MNIDNILAHAQQVMLNENFWAKVDASTPGAPNGGIKSREAKMFKESANNAPVQQLHFTQPQQTIPQNSKIDKTILESFQKTPSMSGVINGSDYAGDIPASYFAGLNGSVSTPNGEKSLPDIQYQHKPMQLNETMQQGTQYVPQANAGIDYNYIKYLIDESIKSYFENNKVLNESANLAGMKMAGGNKIHFVDSKGNIYEAVLTLKKKKV